MFERYSEAAKLALFGARLEVSESGSAAIETEHLLLGLLQARGGIAARLTQAAGVNADSVRTRVLSGATTSIPTSVEVRFAPAVTKALDVAVAEADAMSCKEITTGHLLLGLVRDEHSTASVLLREAGLGLNALRTAVQAQATEGAEASAPDIGEVFEDRIRTMRLDP
ncbi:Clp protease N-terminal domain-containing protein [Luteitalea sp.]|uniref:Clp protease N-terminal domain-containing protein n=1 Tax=Luteitalea sp. TaxID=2004800 RepID=UPI0025BA211A|nr:Clp protease N-terminal domain-containing protein [Luteitalea sp.]